MLFVIKKIIDSIVIVSIIIESFLFCSQLVVIGFIIAINPITSRMFAMFEPITFPIAIPGEFIIVAVSDALNSGKLVPIAIIVKPIMNSFKPNDFAIFELASTKVSADLIIIAAEAMNISKSISIIRDFLPNYWIN